jgi:hypothetical protein
MALTRFGDLVTPPLLDMKKQSCENKFYVENTTVLSWGEYPTGGFCLVGWLSFLLQVDKRGE